MAAFDPRAPVAHKACGGRWEDNNAFMLAQEKAEARLRRTDPRVEVVDDTCPKCLGRVDAEA